MKGKKIGFILLIQIICFAISNAITIPSIIHLSNGFNFIEYLQWVFFIDIFLALFANVLFAHQYGDGKVAELLFFISTAIIIGNVLAYVLFVLIVAGFDLALADWVGCLLRVLRLDPTYYGLTFLFAFLFAVFYATVINKNVFDFAGLGGLKASGALKQVQGSNLENSRWMNSAERSKNFKSYSYSQLAEVKKDGIPVGAKVIGKNKEMEIEFNSPCHTIAIGSTGSGKTTTFVSPMIQLLGATKAGSSMVITDPKGELFMLHSKFLKDRGYDVKVVDLRDPYASYRWNPMDSIWDMNEEYLNAHKKARREKGEVPEGLKLRDSKESFDPDNYYYVFDGCAYSDYDHLISAIKVYKKQIFDEVYEDLNDLVSVLIPVENEKDPMWEKGARSIALAVLLAMLEDAGDERMNMTKNKFTFFNLAKILQNSSNDYEELRNYFKGRSPLSKALALSKQVCDAATQTRASYMSIVYEKMTLFNDAGICALTSASDFTAEGLAERPTALFLKIPDEKDTRHNLAAIFILNIYKTLIKVASAREELALPRNVYFIMDEFGNMPKIEKFDKFITVGRSRKIWFTMIIQSYAQLNNVYGETVADIVKGNCGIKMFIGSNDMGTCKEYSELCGNITVLTSSTSTNSESKGVSVSQQTQVRPLIYPSELQRLNHPGDIGHSIIVTFGNYPLKTYFTPQFLVPFYKIGKMEMEDAEKRTFDEAENFYDVSKRNSIVLNLADKAPEVELKLQAKPEETEPQEAPETEGKPTTKKKATEKTAETEEGGEEKPKRKRRTKAEIAATNDQMEVMQSFHEWKKSNPTGTLAQFFEDMANRALEREVVTLYHEWRKKNPTADNNEFYKSHAQKKEQ